LANNSPSCRNTLPKNVHNQLILLEYIAQQQLILLEYIAQQLA